MTESRKKLRLMAHRDTRICRNLLKWQNFSIFISLRLTFISLCRGFHFLAFGFHFLALGFPFLVSGARLPAAAKKGTVFGA